MINLESIAPEWPVVKGDYVVGTPESRIAVVTLASTLEPYLDAAIWGTCKTENLGAEKIIANIISNSNIRYILVCGGESRGHLAGQTLLALHKNGIDEHGRIIGSGGAIPFIENIKIDAIERFQKQVRFIVHIGLTDIGQIRQIVNDYKNKGAVYDEETMVVGTTKKKHAAPNKPISGDLMISDEFMVDVTAGIIYSAEVEALQ
ncbi:MAG TPA: tetrahydromethanopterin S-methyltransferase subunit A [Methanosarcinaceae archaeon]|nr:tetrahydromethanopterin S-methyltransferase subunit A [Methanosarcinaceae archaeon]